MSLTYLGKQTFSRRRWKIWFQHVEFLIIKQSSESATGRLIRDSQNLVLRFISIKGRIKPMIHLFCQNW